jgi:hypothetical protein
MFCAIINGSKLGEAVTMPTSRMQCELQDLANPTGIPSTALRF